MSKSIAAMHVAKRQFGLDDDTYRAKLHKIVGKSSSKDMTEAERAKVLQVFRNEGLKSAPAARTRANGKPKLTGKHAKKMQALWIAGWNLGVVRDRDDAALMEFICGRAVIDAAEWLRYADDLKKTVEPLKAMLARDGGVDWSKSRFMPPWMQDDGYRIAIAQWRILGYPGDFWTNVSEIVGPEFTMAGMTRGHWISVMNRCGRSIREQKAGGK